MLKPFIRWCRKLVQKAYKNVFSEILEWTFEKMLQIYENLQICGFLKIGSLPDFLGQQQIKHVVFLTHVFNQSA